jgi:hypothetical protein
MVLPERYQTEMATKKRQQYTAEFKAKAVLESLQRDTTIEAVRAKYGVSNSMIHRWPYLLNTWGTYCCTSPLREEPEFV